MMSIDYASPVDGPESQTSVPTVDRTDLMTAACRSLRDAWRRAAVPLCRSLRAHLLFIATIAIYVTAELFLPAMLGIATPFEPAFSYGFFASMSGLTLAVPACLYIFYVMIFVRPTRLTLHLVGDVRRFISMERVAAVVPVFALFPFFGSAFSYFRIYIPSFRPFSWDPTLAEWDRWLHGGIHPWEWLQPVLGHPYITTIINGFYHLWFAAMFGVILWQMGSLSRPRLRMQFFLTFVLLWALLGNIAATLLSSAGPVYYGRVTHLDDPFAPLMDYLRAANEVTPVWALNVQELLWTSYTENGLAIIGGMTAMPSMHIATSTAFMLVALATNRRLGYLFAAFAVLMQIGSVHLGWHYAIDGYVAAIGTWVIWLAVGWFLRRNAIIHLLWGKEADAHGTS
jgi:hypothetical protein